MRKGPQIRKLPHVTLALALSMDELYTTCKHTQNVQFGTRKQNKPPNTPDKDKKKRRRRSPELPIPADADIRGWSNKNASRTSSMHPVRDAQGHADPSTTSHVHQCRLDLVL
jgi:hypothetical protein